MNFLPKCRSIYLSQIKSDLHETFSIFQDRSPELTNNVRGCASARVHAKRVKLCMQLWAVYNPSYFSQMKSDIHETFSICQDWSPELINNVRGCVQAHARVHAQRVELCTQIWAVYNPSYFSQMKSDIHETFSICQDYSPELINNVPGCACACVHAQRVKTGTQLGAVYKPSYLSQIQSNIQETFIICQD